jgi:seryl-tRNA synthetase
MKRMKYKIVVFTFLLLALVGCKNRAERAAEYNDSIIVYQKNIISALENMDSTFRDTNCTAEGVGQAYFKLQSQVKTSIVALDSIDLFRQYEDLVDKDYKKLLEIKLLPASSVSVGVSDTNNAVQLRIHHLTKMSQEKFLVVQSEFGKKYHLELE